MLNSKTEFIANLEKQKISPLGKGFYACATDPTVMNLGTAENQIMNDFLEPIIKNRPFVTPYDMTYSAGFNQDHCRAAFAKLFTDHFGIKNVKASNILFGSGIAFLIERYGLAFLEEQDVVLIPAPCYGGFEPDLIMCKCKVEFIDLDKLPPTPPANAKLLLLTNPGNPYGSEIQNQKEVLEWAFQNPDLHVVTDEVYALTNRKGKPFQSIAGLECSHPERVHLMYGLSKDWGLAGLHVGIFYSENDEVVRRMRLSFGCFCLPSDTLKLMTAIFGDVEFRDKFIAEFRKRLAESCDYAVSTLEAAGIKCSVYDNSLFFMIDLKDIAGANEEAELGLWMDLITKYKVHVLPGKAGFRCSEYGTYRLCFSCPKEVLEQGLKNLISAVKELRSK